MKDEDWDELDAMATCSILLNLSDEVRLRVGGSDLDKGRRTVT